MSSTNRGRQRVRADNYPTPAWCVRRILEETNLPAGNWLEPCAGEGAIIRAVNRQRQDVSWTAVEIRQEACRDLLTLHAVDSVCANFLTLPPPPHPYAVTITNPPFILAMQFVQACQAVSQHVVMLLRLNFLASEARSDFMRSTRPDVYVLPNRPSFVRGGQTDSIEYAWFHWHPESQGVLRVLPTTPAAERKRRDQE